MIEILNVIWKPAIEILILAVGIYYILRFVWGTRGFSILTGFLVVLLTLALITSFF
jgi:DNA integrity scanning protein DisA with diadenylate cyclase activity